MNFYFPEHLLVAVPNHCKILKIFIYKKLLVYIWGRRKPKCLAFQMEI